MRVPSLRIALVLALSLPLSAQGAVHTVDVGGGGDFAAAESSLSWMGCVTEGKSRCGRRGGSSGRRLRRHDAVAP